MNLPYPDNPTPVSLDFLKKLDQDAPGTWLAQPKLDGWRRCCWLEDGKWTIRSKSGSEGHEKPMPEAVMAALGVLAKQLGYREGLDAEWIGPRQVLGIVRLSASYLVIHDVLTRQMDARSRQAFIESIKGDERRIFIAKARPNPGLVDFFQEQVSNPLSEGLVIRRADSKLILSETACATNPYILKVKYRNVKEKA